MRIAWRPGRRTRRIAFAGAIVIAVPLLLLAEAAFAFSGPGSPTPTGTADGTYGDAAAPPLRLVILGDSTGVGVGASSIDRTYPHLVATSLAQDLHRRIDLRVLAVSGARVADVLHDQLPQVAALRPQLLLILIGGNDVVHLTPMSSDREDLRALLNGAKATGAAVVVSSVPAMGTVTRAWQPLRWLLGAVGRKYDDIWREETAAAGLPRIELAANTEQPFTDDPSLLSGDGFHPSDRGYAKWAEIIEPALRAAAPKG